MPSVAPIAWHPYEVAFPQQAEVAAVGTDGTVYVWSYEHLGGTFKNQALVALGPDGAPRARWTPPALPDGLQALRAVALPDGGLVLEQEQALAGADSDSPIVVWRIDRDGATISGWPVTVGFGQQLGRLRVSPSGSVEFAWIDANQANGTVEKLNADGTRAVGWPVAFPGSWVIDCGVADDGTSYVEVIAGIDGTGKSQVLALGPDGQAVAGWHPYEGAAGSRACVVPAASARVAFTLGTRTVPDRWVWLDSRGDALGPTFTGPKAMSSLGVVVGPDGTQYAGYRTDSSSGGGPSGPGLVVALGSNGSPRPGWPVEFEGWVHWVLPAMDGTVWVIEHPSETTVRFDLVSAAGQILSNPSETANWFGVYPPGAVGPDGTLYATDTVGTLDGRGGTRIIAVKPSR